MAHKETDIFLWQTLPFNQKLVLLPTKIGGAPHPDLLHCGAVHVHLCEGPPGEGDKSPRSLGVFRRDRMEGPNSERQKQTQPIHKRSLKPCFSSRSFSMDK